MNANLFLKKAQQKINSIIVIVYDDINFGKSIYKFYNSGENTILTNSTHETF